MPILDPGSFDRPRIGAGHVGCAAARNEFEDEGSENRD